MKKRTQKEQLIEDFHKKLAQTYYEWSLLFFYYHSKSYKSGGTLSLRDKRKLEQDSRYKQELIKRMINEDFSADHGGKYGDVKKDADWHFEYNFKQDFEAQMLSGNDDDLKAFVKSIGKELNAAILGLIEVERNERETLDFNDGLSFLISAEEYRNLYIIYNNYDEIVKILEKEKFVFGNIHYLIESYKDNIVRDGSELITTWLKKTKIIKRSRHGGKQPRDKKGYYLAIKEVLEKLGTNASAQQIWDYFKRHHDKPSIDLNEKEPLYIEEYQIYFDRDELVQNLEGKKRQISRKVVGTYLTKIRPIRKK